MSQWIVVGIDAVETDEPWPFTLVRSVFAGRPAGSASVTADPVDAAQRKGSAGERGELDSAGSEVEADDPGCLDEIGVELFLFVPAEVEPAAVDDACRELLDVIDVEQRKRGTETRGVSAPVSWSPGGSRLAFIRRFAPWTMKRDGTDAKLVADMGGNRDQIAWSPDSRWLVTDSVDRGDLMLVRIDGSEIHPLTNTPDIFNAWLAWQRLPR